jgi:hypothetical protein
MNTRNIQKLAEQKSFYKQIEKNEGLLWLTHRYFDKNSNWENPIAEYEYMLSKLFWFRIMHTTLVTLALVGYYFIATWGVISINDWIALQGKFVQLVLTMVLFVTFYFPFILTTVCVAKTFISMMEAWFETNWVTKSFEDEVTRIFETNNYSDGLTWLIGKGSETKDRLVPQHVTENCTEHLIKIAKSIKASDLGIEVMTPENIERLKGHLKYMVNLFGRYSIIGRHPEIRYYYQEAERLLKAEQAEKNLAHESTSIS